MLIKTADDKTKRLALLESLQGAPVLNSQQNSWLAKELWNCKEGIRGERDAAHYIDNHFADDGNLAVIHDLRLEVDGEVAQIDHLLISRGFVFYLLETKQYNGNLHINEFGEFSVSYGADKVWGIPSPLEQSRRHQNVLLKLLMQLGITGRTQKEPEFRHVVLFNPQSQIHRPAREAFDTSSVIKADQFAFWREKYVHGEVTFLKTLNLMMNMRATETVKEWAHLLCEQHKPQNVLALPDFMATRKVPTPTPTPVKPQPKPARSVQQRKEPVAPNAAASVPCAVCEQALSAAEQAFCRDRSSKFGGQFFCIQHQKDGKQRSAPEAAKAERPPPSEAPQKSLVCSTCKTVISFAEGRFCWNNERRFGGSQYCRVHQKDFV